MGLLNNTSDNDLLKSTVKEIAKAKNELRCAEGDVKKATSRLSYLIVLVNELLDRQDTD